MHHIHRVRPHHQGHGAAANRVDAFVAFHLADARQVSARSGVPISVILAQSGLESGWGLHVTDNAYFGVKGHAPNGASVRFTAHEVSNGVAHRISDSFRSYRSYADAANDYADMLRRRFPAAFAHADDSLQFIPYLHGYATDPLYIGKLQSIIRHHELQQYDHKP
jgi:flagellum-specific peptidoglycan hydrolase FlgJ